ncbi:MAG: malate synthase G [Gammaproteobacteria bacterium]|nr:malate synthase G [Gammaproteobacteria bacterium]|tara:strand:+ start:1247 stop:3448 length:2202 start_codon:yes stop_codon:yes gene_type:complete
MKIFSRFFKQSITQTKKINEISLDISENLKEFVNDELLPGLNISPEYFWSTFQDVLNKFSIRNKELLDKREDFQEKINNWHIENKDESFDVKKYKTFLESIGYLFPRSGNFSIKTFNVDPEIRKIAGPQLVVPVMNARFALNATNARWGSLYDALYGTNMISESDGAIREGGYNPIRGNRVIAFAKNFLDETFPLKNGKYNKVVNFEFIKSEIVFILDDNSKTALLNKDQYIGYMDKGHGSYGLLFKNNNLHIEIQVDRSHPIGQEDPAGIKDILVESAITTIQDCEDSVAAVDAEDKIIVYRNWLGLMKGDLKRSFNKNGKYLTRELNGDRRYLLKNGKMILLPGRSLLLVRNVGHLMTNPAIKDQNDNEIPEGIMDAFFTICASIHDIEGNSLFKNSKTKSIYIVKPKMHGPEEVQFTCDLFSEIEDIFNLPRNTVKLGIMDEERRTTVNLKECIEIAKNRVIFINTGFLDRTGDEIHTSMEAGPMVTKGDMKKEKWINAYEDWNVDVGLETGFKWNAQIGKGMWAMPDEMLDMYQSKTIHPKSGANCAWVPSPTAATLHAIHYHQIFVQDEQDRISKRKKASLDDILSIPLITSKNMPSRQEIQKELDNNAQGILGYVVRWIDQGIGCSKVPDINDIGLMEDRATCRISSQHISNWLYHGLCSKEQVIDTMKKMARIVDLQNKNDTNYRPMAPSFDGIAFKAACDLAIKGKDQPSGYTEPILHEMRLKRK